MFPRRIILVIGTFLITVLLYVDRACIGAAKENISSDFNLTNLQWTWVLAIFTLGYALFQRPAGQLSDKKGPRFVMACIIGVWSFLTALTGAAWNAMSLLVIRFLFGAGEAGAFPTLSKVVFKWFPIKERGIVQGINFSGSRLGAAFAYPIVFILISAVGWKWSFGVFGIVGVLFAVVWWIFFRDTPEEIEDISAEEKKYIIDNRQEQSSAKPKPLDFIKTMKSSNLWMAMIQYIGSNFTFYFTLTWMFPYLKEALKASGTNTSFYAMAPLIAGALGNWVSGFMVDKMYASGRWRWSRRLPAMIGFTLAAIGMFLMPQADSTMMKLLLLSIAIFGADMTLSPSWAFCIDIGKEHAGSVSGTMNMAGNLGAFASILVFGYLAESLISSGLNAKEAMAANDMFFYICAGLSVLSIIMWSFMRPRRSIVD
ncbi:MFS transporter [Labilibacter marinus]|uniref:MFS transporter n=1 Tax=Labilibacter marinus TaxID=1477105 RepID=UPI00082B1EAC|nr:MFS transporter [Labilibacter marinus]